MCNKKWSGLLKDYETVEFYPDYRDRLSPNTIVEILEADDPESVLADLVADAWEPSCESVRDDIFSRAIRDLGRGLTDEEREELDEAISEQVLFRYPLDHYRKQQVCVNLFLDTGDGNYDFSCNAERRPHWNGSSDPYREEASILWLARQQGYTDEQLYAALDQEKCPDPNTFLGSLYQEIQEATSSMLTVAFFVSMSLEELIDLNQAMRSPEAGKKTLVVSKKVDAGLYDPWYGSGGVLDLMFDRDIEIPLDKLRGPVLPDGKDGYSVANCYGICESLWKRGLTFLKA